MSLDRVGPYRIEQEVGRGAMGVVYLAHDERLDRPVALKSLPAGVAASERRLARFEREARLLAAMSHPNIAHLYALEELDGERFLVMEWVPGTTLGEMLAGRALLPAEALDLCAQVARGIAAAHARGVVHRDLKPTNIRVTPEGIAKVLDFGVAKGLSAWDLPAPIDDASLMAWGPGGDEDANGSSSDGQIQTGAGRIVGTPGYMSPEQARGREVDHRGDVWSLGCIVYECLAGERAFRGDTPMDLIAATLSRDPDWASIERLDIDGLATLLRHAMERDVATRLASVEDFLHQLQGLDTTGSSPSVAPDVQGLVGREDLLGRVAEELAPGRVVTLTGFGGVGKTALARAIAADRETAHAVMLADVDADAVAGTIETSTSTLAPGQLVLLDNAEHAADHVRRHACSLARDGMRVLVTSRSPLGIDREVVVPVEPLPVPAEGEQRTGVIASAPAVVLFAQRLAEQRPGFSIGPGNAARVASICRRLRGLPLAIELAAERAAVMPLEELDRRLSVSLAELVAGGARPDRQRTLASLVEWGWRLLEPSERRAMAQLSVLDGSFDLELAAKLLSNG